MGKFCPKCGKEISNSTFQFCDGCGAKLEKQHETTTIKIIEKKKMPVCALILIAVVIVIVLISILSGGSNDKKDSSSNVTDYNEKTTTNIPKDDSSSKRKVYGYNETFTFDDLEITIGNNLVFDTVKNNYSDYNGQTVVGIPFTVKNLSEETNSLNMFYYSVFGSAGTEVETLNSYFDDTLDYAGDLRYNASYTKYTYVQYDGDGTYSIEFDNYSEKILVEIDITK